MPAKRFFGLDTLRGTLRFYAILLVCLPLVLSMLFFAVFQRSSLLQAQKTAMLASLRHEKALLVFWLNDLAGDLALLARQPALQAGDTPAIDAILSQYLQSHKTVPNIVFANAQGRVTVNSNNAFPFVGDREYFAKARRGEASISDLLISRVTGKELITISAPVLDDQKHFHGVVFIPFELSTLDPFLESVPVGRGGSLYLADASGRIIAPSKAVAEQKKRRRPGSRTRDLLEAHRKGVVELQRNGSELVGAAIPLVPDRWFLVQTRPVSAILAGSYRQLALMSLGVLASIGLFLPLLLRLARNLERPLEQLVGFARELLTNRARATLPECPTGAMPVEMRVLYQTFCEMAHEIRAHIEDAERRSVQDPLTGLYNRRFLFEGGAKLVEAAERSQRRCACLMVDVDHFKRVNDTYGHAAGDLVLIHVADILHACARKSDIVSRYGGEEFAVLLTGADREQGAVVADRMRRSLAETPCRIEGGTVTVTVSIGVAEARQKVQFGQSVLDDLMARADRAMYAAKAAGRNRVEAES